MVKLEDKVIESPELLFPLPNLSVGHHKKLFRDGRKCNRGGPDKRRPDLIGLLEFYLAESDSGQNSTIDA